MEAKQHKQLTLEITIMSGENISVDQNSVTEMNVVVRAESLNCCRTKMVNGDDGVHAWNEKLLLEVPSYARSLTFEVQCNKYKEFRPVGVARIALSDLLCGKNNNVLSQMFCYGLRNWEGRRNGVIHFWVKVVDNLSAETKQEKDIKMVNCRGIENEVTGSDVVIGIPVNWCTNQMVV
ncbi:hypothetical protein PHAVU_010G089900 [Phaseolus vulgaris]|uniref:C2 domain-containing protein n=1 Tax=Phaseolus vulgaris TaxID=3885 RepID=V7ARW3_PHAVU|nr:hypothetical protein PHAVU_010G089900g [Phaseolus vulgaris]ESW06951.1 hypothetical protein PHAVU_010G089900g [Phaseolus vulgaris]